MLTFWNSYVLWLLRCVQLRLVTVTFCDVNVVWCYVLSQYHGHSDKYAAGIIDTGCKFATGEVDTGGNLPPVSLTPVANCLWYRCCTLTCEYLCQFFYKNSKRPLVLFSEAWGKKIKEKTWRKKLMTLSLKIIFSPDVLERRAIKREWQMRKKFSGRFEFKRSRLALLLLLCLPAVPSSFLHLEEPSRQQVRTSIPALSSSVYLPSFLKWKI